MCLTTETQPVTFTVQSIDPVQGAGRLMAFATVIMEIAGVEMLMQGVQVLREANGNATVQAPTFRHPRTGRWLPALVLPPELREAIGNEVIAYIIEASANARRAPVLLPAEG